MSLKMFFLAFPLMLIFAVSLTLISASSSYHPTNAVVVYNSSSYVILGISFIAIDRPFNYVFPPLVGVNKTVEVNATIYPKNTSSIRVVYRGYRELGRTVVVNVDIHIPAEYYAKIPVEIGVNKGFIVKVSRLNETFLAVSIILRDVRIDFYSQSTGHRNLVPVLPRISELDELPSDRNELRVNGIPIWFRNLTWRFIVNKETGEAWLARDNRLEYVGVLPLLPLSWGMNPYNYLSRIASNTKKALLLLSNNKELLKSIVEKLKSIRNTTQRIGVESAIEDAVETGLVYPKYSYLDMKCMESITGSPLSLLIQCHPVAATSLEAELRQALGSTNPGSGEEVLRTFTINITHLFLKRPSFQEAVKLRESLLEALRENNTERVEKIIASLVRPYNARVEPLHIPLVSLALRGAEIPWIDSLVLPPFPGVFNDKVYLWFRNEPVKTLKEIIEEDVKDFGCNTTNYNYTFNGLVLVIRCNDTVVEDRFWPLDPTSGNHVVVVADKGIAGALRSYTNYWYSAEDTVRRALDGVVNAITALVRKAGVLGPERVTEEVALGIYNKYLGWLDDLLASRGAGMSSTGSVALGPTAARGPGEGSTGTAVALLVLVGGVVVAFGLLAYLLWRRGRVVGGG